MLRIGDFSKLAQVSVKTLRYYHEYGLLKPAWTDRFNGYRYYRLDQLPTLNRILALKELGFTLEQIQTILRDNLTADQLRGMMNLRKAELERQIQLDQARLYQIDARLHQLEESRTKPDYQIVLKQIDAKSVAGIRKKIKKPEQLYSLYVELCSQIPAALILDDPSLPVAAIYHDSEFRQGGSDVEMVVPVSHLDQITSSLSTYQLPGLEQVSCLVHQGPLSSLQNAYQALVTWTQYNGYQVSGPTRQVFLQGFDENLATVPFSPIITEVQLPVEKRSIPISIQNPKENQPMQPKILTKPAFTVVGLKYFGQNKNNEIAQLWQDASPRFREIKHAIFPPYDAYGVCGNMDKDCNFEYIAGVPVSKTEEIPENMSSWAVPEQTYAVFPCTLKQIHQTYEFAHNTWIPEQGYKRTDGPDFEFYDETFEPEDPESLLYVYIPVEK